MLPVLEFIKNRKIPIKITHRGGMALYPENTLEAFHKSVDNHQVEMLEMDLHLTKDEKVLVLHDPSIDRTTNGTGFVKDMNYEEISKYDAGFNFKNKKGKYSFRNQGTTIPLFEDVLKQLPYTYFNIELKSNNHKLAESVAQLIKKYNVEDRILIGSANLFLNNRVRRLFPKCGHYLSQPDIFLLTILGNLKVVDNYIRKFHIIEVPIKYKGIAIYRKFIKIAKKLELPLFFWGINSKEILHQLNGERVAGFMTDYPDLF